MDTTPHVAIDEVAESTQFSGVVRVDVDGDTVVERAYGFADRAHGIPNEPTTQFAIASGSKAFTALAVIALVESGALRLDTTARSVLGRDLPLIADDVTIEHLLAHRSGIGDYLDEDELESSDQYVLPIPVHELADTERFVSVLDGFPTKFAAGSQFAYCNGGYAVLAVIAQRVSGIGFHDLVEQSVCAPAGLTDTAYLRLDELPGTAAIGYLYGDGLRSNVLHLPVRGNGDGGIFTTAADVQRFWTALFDGRIVPDRWVREMVTPRSTQPEDGSRYGLGFWIHATTDEVILLGGDAGVSFQSGHDPAGRYTYSVLANTSDGAGPLVGKMRELLPRR
jgi:CubicO group peptidase (beta-lactamase class C family)